MKRRAVRVAVSDHAVLRWLERGYGLDVKAVKAAIAGKVMTAAELGAVSICLEGLRYTLRDVDVDAAGIVSVVVPTVLDRQMPFLPQSITGRDEP